MSSLMLLRSRCANVHWVVEYLCKYRVSTLTQMHYTVRRIKVVYIMYWSTKDVKVRQKQDPGITVVLSHSTSMTMAPP